MRNSRAGLLLAGGATIVSAGLTAGAALGSGAGPPATAPSHVLLISVDGRHGSDLARWVAANPDSALAGLSREGTTYTHASTTTPSDSFPGLLALITGGTPKSTGVYYDTSYDRTLFPPGSNCTGKPGTEVVYDESADRDPSALDGGGGLDPAKLPLEKQGTQCTPVFPHRFLRVNTVFNVVKAAGRPTAWSDKHPAYDLVNGHAGGGVDDLCTPEIASGPDYTTSVPLAEQYDGLR